MEKEGKRMMGLGLRCTDNVARRVNTNVDDRNRTGAHSTNTGCLEVFLCDESPRV